MIPNNIVPGMGQVETYGNVASNVQGGDRANTPQSETQTYSPVQLLKAQFNRYASTKFLEIEEARQAWCYYYGLQYTDEQIRKLEKRGQPPIVFDRVGRKIDGLVGTIRRIRTDPKAYPRTANDENGAEVATQVVRTILDSSGFEDIETDCVRDAAVAGICAAEMTFVTHQTVDDRGGAQGTLPGFAGDPEIGWRYIDPRTFFYDPTSVRSDFADARYMGTYKWATQDEIDEILPPGESFNISGEPQSEVYTTYDTDREILWTDERNRVRLVDHWYIKNGVWHWCLHIGSQALQQGTTPFYDDRGVSLSKYKAFSTFIDSRGDHIGYMRRLKGPQDAINQHRSKALHIMNTRQIVVKRGAVEENGGIEKLRREAARPDGVIEYSGNKDDIQVIQPEQEFLQQTQYFQDAKQEIETFGPNPALLGDMGAAASGRAYAMAQQAGLAELGPFLKNYRAWKLDMYRMSWWAAQRYWTSERFLRVTDDQGIAQFLQLNMLQVNPMTQQPVLVNALGRLDVDIVLDEGKDTETVMGDVYDVLIALAQSKVPVPPAAIIQVSNLPGTDKRKLIAMLGQQSPEQQMAQQLQLQGAQAEVQEKQSKTALNVAKAQHASAQARQPPHGAAGFEMPPELQMADQIAKTRQTQATTVEKLARAQHLATAAAHDRALDVHDRLKDLHDMAHDRRMDAHQVAMDHHDRGQAVVEMLLDAHQQQQQHELQRRQMEQQARQVRREE
jgi:hypothetical protein